MRRYGVIGWKNSGKTTLVERLVALFVLRGLAVSTVKHAHHALEIDQPGKDTWRHRAAGATEVAVTSDRRWALMHELRGAPAPGLDALIGKLTPVDLVLVEGFKSERHPKIEAHRATLGHPLLAPEDPTIRAVASDAPLTVSYPSLQTPRFPLDASEAVADFILADLGMR